VAQRIEWQIQGGDMAQDSSAIWPWSPTPEMPFETKPAVLSISDRLLGCRLIFRRVTMSDLKPDSSTPAAKADPAATVETQAAGSKDVAGHLAAKKMTIFDQIFIWTMVLLVGVIFGVGPSIGLVMQGQSQFGSYKVDMSDVQRRQRVAEALQEIINPNGYGEPMFSKMMINQPPYIIHRSEDSYARNIRMAQMADDLGLTPSKAEVQILVDDFLAKKDPTGKSTYAQKIADSRRAKDITTADLEMWLSEEFAIDALDARSTAMPVLPAAVSTTFKPLREEKISSDQIVLSARSLLSDIKPDDAEFQSTYESLANLNRFVVPAATVVQVAAPDFAALLAAQSPTDEQAKAWYEGHKADYKKPAPPAPANGQTPAPAAEPEYRPFDEVKVEILDRLRRDGASAAALAKVEAFIATVENDALEQGNAAAFAKAAADAGLIVKGDTQIPDTTGGQVLLPGYGLLKHSAREIGLVTSKPGSITDQQQTHDGQWLVLRFEKRLPASKKPIDDPEVRAVVSATLAGKRAYPVLLAAAEALREQAEKAGPGGLRSVFADPAVKAKWNAEVTTSDMSVLEELTFPQPADAATARPDPRIAASLAVKGNPVVLVEVQQRGNDGDSEIPEVRLVQSTGLTAAAAPTTEERTQLASQLRGFIAGRLSAAAQAAIGRKL